MKAVARAWGQILPVNWPDEGGAGRSEPSGSWSGPGVRGWEDETIRWEGRQRVTVGRRGPRVWVWVTAEKAVLTATQFGTGGERNSETEVYFWHLLSKEHCFSLALCLIVQSLHTALKMLPPRAKPSFLSYCSTAWNCSPHPAVPVIWAQAQMSARLEESVELLSQQQITDSHWQVPQVPGFWKGNTCKLKWMSNLGILNLGVMGWK